MKHDRCVSVRIVGDGGRLLISLSVVISNLLVFISLITRSR